MGIPFYFRKLALTFGTQFIKKIKKMEECDCLYLDFNSMIHQYANDIVSKNPQEEKIQSYYLPIANALIDAIINLCNIVRPRKMLYIAIDGMCPRAKMQQQRKRRYMTTWRTRKEGNLLTPKIWDSNVITPGTDFMSFLDEALEAFIEKNKSRLGFQIVLSKSSDIGEGEHKMFHVMQENEDAIIYGLDADLIMLSMISTNHKNIRLLREQASFGTGKTNSNETTTFSLLEIAPLRELIFQEYRVNMEDYVMLCVLLGNDFVPPLSYLSMRGNGVEGLIEAYKALGEKKLVNSGHLNMNHIIDLFHVLAGTENEGMSSACETYYSMKPKMSQKNIDCYPQYTKCKTIIDPKKDPNWRNTYYQEIVKGDSKSVCIEYLRGIQWVFDYYFKKNASTTWYYPYSYSPSIKELQYTAYEPIVEENALDPKLQLLLVLPPQSVDIIQQKEAKLLVSIISKGVSHYYPVDFQVSTFLKTYLWECSPVLPNINIEIIKRQLQSAIV